MPDPCDIVCQDPVNNCYAAPWCACCSTCLPGGGGAFRPADDYHRPLRPGDAGEFAPLFSKSTLAARVLTIQPNGRLTIEVTEPNGSRFIEPDVDLAASEGEWNAYRANSIAAQKILKEELKSAYADWAMLGHDPLRSVYFEGCYYPANHDFHNTAIQLQTNHDCTLNLLAYFRRNAGQMFCANVPELNQLELPNWKRRRSLWLPIYNRYLSRAKTRISEYTGGKYE